MNTNNIMPESYEIDLAELVRLFWRNKLIILILSILCATFGHLYTLKLDKSKEFKSEIITRTPLKSHFLVYDPFLNPKDYSKEFNSKISSIDFLEKFVNQNNNIPKFKNYLQNNNISAKLYFAKKFTKILSDNDQPIENKFSLTYHESLDGNTFLNELNELNDRSDNTEKKNKKVNKIINKYYDFYGYREFANKIDKLITEMKNDQISIDNLNEELLEEVKPLDDSNQPVVIEEIPLKGGNNLVDEVLVTEKQSEVINELSESNAISNLINLL